MYKLIKPLLFQLDPELAHDLSMGALHQVAQNPFLMKLFTRCYANKVPDLPVSCMGLDFRHPIGLAAGLDKSARAVPALTALGFSSVECGTVTPKPQPGNEKPRLFRIPEQEAILNRMGFNSGGLDVFLANLQQAAVNEKSGQTGINIGKNASTAIVDAHKDYVSALQRVYPHADYITVNISSPNTQSLRDLQSSSYLDELLAQIKQAHAQCQQVHGRYVPVALKVAPDLDEREVEIIAELLLAHHFDALIATNTTIERPASLPEDMKQQAGGLSGRPVKELSTLCIKRFYQHLKGDIPIVGVGGIANADDAWEKLLAGADLLQIYSLFIYRGPKMIPDIVRGLEQKIALYGYNNLQLALKELR